MRISLAIRAALLPLTVLLIVALASAQGPMTLEMSLPGYLTGGHGPGLGFDRPLDAKGGFILSPMTRSKDPFKHHFHPGFGYYPYHGYAPATFYWGGADYYSPCLPNESRYSSALDPQGLYLKQEDATRSSESSSAESSSPESYSRESSSQGSSSPESPEKMVTTGNVFIIRASQTAGGEYFLPEGDRVVMPEGWEIIPADADEFSGGQ
ncbi:MAG: hypothetical protein C4524_08180 [Candidatus Zixiibacteriota bacterium]|nr:MAG: hypothetical protein C4524_08180 [candidate division Zixibacteria bacterium]